MMQPFALFAARFQGNCRHASPPRAFASSWDACAMLLIVLLAMLSSKASAAGQTDKPPASGQKHTIGLVLTSWRPAMLETPNLAQECPAGLQSTNRDNFNVQFKTAQEREQFQRQYLHLAPLASSGDSATPEQYLLLRGPGGIHVAYNPTAVVDALPLRMVQSKIAPGFNLDGTTDGRATPKSCAHEKFLSPDGKLGVDNQLYRIIGCAVGWRSGGLMLEFTVREFRESSLNRVLVEISGVEDERNSADVEVSFYKGVDAIAVDASGSAIPWLTHRVDIRYPQFVTRTHGRIVNGVLETDAVDARFGLFQLLSDQERYLRGMRLRLVLSEAGATGLVGGYEDFQQWWNNYSKSFGVIANEDGLWSPPATYAAARQLADGFPDPQSGQCTGLSAAYEVEGVRAFIVHPANDSSLARDPEMALARTALAKGSKAK